MVQKTVAASIKRGGFALRALKNSPKRSGDWSANDSQKTGSASYGGAAHFDRAGQEPRFDRKANVAGQFAFRRRVKRLVGLVALSACVAFISIVYGLWAQVSSDAAVSAATSGELPTLVARNAINAGEPINLQALDTKNIPAAFRIATALEPEALEGSGIEGRRALVDIPAGTQITSSFVTGASDSGHLAAQLASGMEGVTLSVDAQTGLAGRIKPFDQVRVVSAEGASSGTSALTTLCESARVVALGEGAMGGESLYSSLTIEVTPSQANAIREAQYAGHVSLLLRSTNDALVLGDSHG